MLTQTPDALPSTQHLIGVAAAAVGSGAAYNLAPWLVTHLQLIGALIYVLTQVGGAYLVWRAFRSQRRQRPVQHGPLRGFVVDVLQLAIARLQESRKPEEVRLP